MTLAVFPLTASFHILPPLAFTTVILPESQIQHISVKYVTTEMEYWSYDISKHYFFE